MSEGRKIRQCLCECKRIGPQILVSKVQAMRQLMVRPSPVLERAVRLLGSVKLLETRYAIISKFQLEDHDMILGVHFKPYQNFVE